MALRGTLKDFGIADIFQLIGHQAKTGILTVRSRDQAVQIHFVDGNIVHATSATRKQRDLLGRMLVRAEVVTERQVEEALTTQKRTLKRLGDVLLAQGSLDQKTLRAFTRLQTTETIYRLFLWDAGTYEFKQLEVGVDPDSEPIRSESVLMEGFRQVDEWPGIRKRIASYALTFERLEDLDALTSAQPSGADDDLQLDGAFEDSSPGGDQSSQARLRNIGQNERTVYQLLTPERDVQKIIDLSRLGEFETCKALVTLLDAGIIAPADEGQKRKASAAPTVGGIHARERVTWAPIVTHVVLGLALLVGAVVTVRMLGVRPQAWLVTSAPGHVGHSDVALQSELARGRMQLIGNALEVYRAETGAYPDQLGALVRARLVEQRDLTFPWEQPYYYQRRGDGTYILLRPLY